ncbi:ATP-dependent zinc metalloprotease FtsH [Desulfobulbus oligotrophicus]|jgi:cell division protease FtsH|uniref:ATP-dependent zinc metalloprotease FtsH n=1 Tax=Desulfobulbus oligotrophicus TaxID=1909699 RepID=A0A7T5VBF8_9BACT|nr:ATP-dependent zinc metalloprotease FtsH [Desulfobulbus oligotrophicus]MDY0390504.1 ATP-dependent zinc metalloprotease FtsH [Desulfobulbus oligotrophicus]QQG64795.1 ATP-dependent zinc metalloprotease FtsH [Desulfobulbus oligotrophicus]
MDNKQKFNAIFAIFAVVSILVIHELWVEQQSIAPVPYSELENLLQQNKIAELTIREKFIVGELKEAENGKKTIVANRVEPELAEHLSQYKVPYTQVYESKFLATLLSWIVPALVFFGIWMFVLRRFAEKQGMGGSFMNIGKSKAKVYVEQQTGVTFDDVAGVDESKAELQEIVDFLKNPDEYGKLGARMPKGVLLVGPPGTGKTLLARAVAGQAAVPFFSISGSEFVEMFVGVGAARVRDLFEQARKSAPAIIFIDELDALGRVRTAAGIGGNDEREQTLNQLLVELDGFDPSSGLVLLAATNRPEVLDPALLRAGRFDRQVLVDRPDKLGRIAILQVHMKKIRLGDDVDPSQVADLTTGFSGADLANLVNEAALLATRRQAEEVSMHDFTQAIERIIAGLEKKNRLLNPKERKIVAYHEVGHALTALALPGTDPVFKISIIPRGIGSLGYTLQRPTEDRFLMTKEELENKIAVLLGGRAAEKLIFDHLSTGASDDIARATDIARNMVTRYGMDPDIGFVVYEENQPSFLAQQGHGHGVNGCQISDSTAQRIDDSVRKIIDDTFVRTYEIMEKNRDILERCAKTLLEKETLLEQELVELTADLKR